MGLASFRPESLPCILPGLHQETRQGRGAEGGRKEEALGPQTAHLAQRGQLGG